MMGPFKERFFMRRCIAASAAALLLLPAIGQAQSAAVALKVGTFGPSLGVVVGASDKLNVRVDVPFLNFNYVGDEEIDDFAVDISADVKLFSVGAMADFHPFSNGFRVTGGALYNNREVRWAASSPGDQTVGDETYTAAEIGTLYGVVEMGSKIAPYLGIGFGNPLSPNKKLGFVVDLGVLYQGSPKVTMTGTGMIEPTAQEASKVENNLEWAKYYPGLSIGLTYKVR
jgi:hypothetical protein